MFTPNKKFTLFPEDNFQAFMEKRLVFDGKNPEKPKAPEAPTGAGEKELHQDEIEKKLNKDSGKPGVDFTGNSDKALEALATKVYETNKDLQGKYKDRLILAITEFRTLSC